MWCKELKLNNDCYTYPIGLNYSSNIDYVEAIAKVLYSMIEYNPNVIFFCYGSSQIILSTMVCDYMAYRLGLNIDHLRLCILNKHSASHSSTSSEVEIVLGYMRCSNYYSVIIDDLISTGATLKKELEIIRKGGFTDKLDMLFISNSDNDFSNIIDPNFEYFING